MDDTNKKKKILIVDDDEIQLLIAEAILGSEYEIITAASGKKALEQIYHGNIPDLILLDILMPEMDGFEVFNRIRAISLLQEIPIAFLTSLDGTIVMEQAQKIGATDFIMKPYSREDLLNRIKNAMDK